MTSGNLFCFVMKRKFKVYQVGTRGCWSHRWCRVRGGTQAGQFVTGWVNIQFFVGLERIFSICHAEIWMSTSCKEAYVSIASAHITKDGCGNTLIICFLMTRVGVGVKVGPRYIVSNDFIGSVTSFCSCWIQNIYIQIFCKWCVDLKRVLSQV